MISNKIILNRVVRNGLQNLLRAHSTVVSEAANVGNRDWVCYGINGCPNYEDRLDFPFPALRFKENTSDVLALKEKEKGDWKKLSIEEKKKLYRTSFCQTLSEVNAPTGEWKSTIGIALAFCSLSLWVYMALKTWVYKPLPESCSEEGRRAQLKRMLDLRIGRIDGISSKWDFDKNEWKK